MQAATTDSASQAIEHITLRSGFDLTCLRHEAMGDKVRLYQAAGYIDIAAAQIASIETQPTEAQPVTPDAAPSVKAIPIASNAKIKPIPIEWPHATLGGTPMPSTLTHDDLTPLLSAAGIAHNIDSDLLWSVVRAESAGNPRAISRAGAQGLMQLMPATASTLGVADSFVPQQNIAGGAAYLDQMLTRYHDNLPLALAAYNAGPEAVDRYHGIPPYRETKLYVARVIAEFNRRKAAARAAQHETAATTGLQSPAVKPTK